MAEDGSAWCQVELWDGVICGSFTPRLPPVQAAWRDLCVHVCACAFASLYLFSCGCFKYPNRDSLVAADLYLDMPTLLSYTDTHTHAHTHTPRHARWPRSLTSSSQWTYYILCLHNKISSNMIWHDDFFGGWVSILIGDLLLPPFPSGICQQHRMGKTSYNSTTSD